MVKTRTIVVSTSGIGAIALPTAEVDAFRFVQATIKVRITAQGTLTLSANVSNNDTVTIDTKVYTFETTLTNVDGNVLIGAAATDSIDNLIAAITLGSGSGTLYAAATTLHPTVSASVGAGDTMIATAKSGGTAGDAVATTETSGTAAWGQATLGDTRAGTESGVPTTSEDLTLTLNGVDGAQYDSILRRVDPSGGTTTGDVVLAGEDEEFYVAGDNLDLAYPNTDLNEVGARIVVERLRANVIIERYD